MILWEFADVDIFSRHSHELGTYYAASMCGMVMFISTRSRVVDVRSIIRDFLFIKQNDDISFYK